MHSLSLCQLCCVAPIRWANAQPELVSGVLCAPHEVGRCAASAHVRCAVCPPVCAPRVCAHTCTPAGVVDTTSYVVVGAAAVLGAACRAPLTAMALMVEITRCEISAGSVA